MRKTIVALTTAAGLVLLSACGSLQEAADTATQVNQSLTTAQVCLDAVNAVDFTPDVDPQQALEQTQNAAEKLSGLAGQAADTTVNEAIDRLAATLDSVTLDDLASPVDWLRQKTDQANALLQACSGTS
ncbi:bacteriophage spanin2 family protein [Actinokineospora bangkokensis]|uniref:Uncharacterized protein n=1 Tax=Actinokineospora bangkokensis TaxID=1193682 RepID=A0A1Q9LNH6_9PSEU|nr:bacteriophage spanin2 family protein [Actinokineospora bangkokensis]OLR93606.1 hypothetical protein BJP25_15110 [Actinokineospora bangkokensis]